MKNNGPHQLFFVAIFIHLLQDLCFHIFQGLRFVQTIKTIGCTPKTSPHLPSSFSLLSSQPPAASAPLQTVRLPPANTGTVHVSLPVLAACPCCCSLHRERLPTHDAASPRVNCLPRADAILVGEAADWSAFYILISTFRHFVLPISIFCLFHLNILISKC